MQNYKLGKVILYARMINNLQYSLYSHSYRNINPNM